jgi:hypothetical protein
LQTGIKIEQKFLCAADNRISGMISLLVTILPIDYGFLPPRLFQQGLIA